MFCGIKILNLAVNAAELRAQDHLEFGAITDIEKMIVLNPIQRAYYQGLTFTLVPLKNTQQIIALNLLVAYTSMGGMVSIMPVILQLLICKM